MESQTKYAVSRARSSKGRILAFIFTLGLIAHGLFFPAEIIAFAFIMLVLFRSQLYRANMRLEALGATDVLLFGLAGLSLLGLLHPVKAGEAWLEAFRYLLYWLVYRFGITLSEDVPLSLWVRRAGWAALLLAVAGGFPFTYSFATAGMAEAGRLNSLLGYANATAAFLAAVLLLPGLNPWLRPVLFLALLSTGSRSAIGLLVLFKVLELWQKLGKLRAKGGLGTFIRGIGTLVKGKNRRGFAALLLGSIGIVALYIAAGEAFRPAWVHLVASNIFDRSWGERLLYLKDGFELAWSGKLLPQAGGWLAFPLVQDIPYWTLDPHSSMVRVLLNQGLAGLLGLGIWAAVWSRKVWHRVRRELSEERRAEFKAYFRLLLFLMLHSSIDADFSFPVLGLIFWFLVGSLTGRLRLEPVILPYERGMRRRQGLSGQPLNVLSQRAYVFRAVTPVLLVRLAFSVFLVFGWGFYWSNPGSVKAFSRDVANGGGIEAWERILRFDQTSLIARRELAEAEFARGDWQAGLQQVEKVLAWQKFDLSAYEWAQNVVWQAIEQGQVSAKQDVRVLYAWMEGIPARINTLAEQVPQSERWLWSGYAGFRATPHLELLARYARERTLQL